MPQTSITLSLYDLLGRVLPGALVVWAGLVLARDVLDINVLPGFPNDSLDTAIFSFVAFAVGFGTQAVARRVERLYINPVVQVGKARKRIFPSEQFMLPNDKHFSQQFKDRFSATAAQRFGVPGNTSEAFNLAYSYLLISGYSQQMDVFNALYGMARALIVSTAITGVVYLARAAFNLDDHEQVKESLFLAAALFLGTLVSFFQARNFSNRFADGVFRAFIAAEVRSTGAS